MQVTRVDIVFVACGVALGALVAYAIKAGWVSPSASSAFPPFIFVLLGLGLVELLAGLATRRPPGSLVGMPARMLAFVAGVGTLILINGGIA